MLLQGPIYKMIDTFIFYDSESLLMLFAHECLVEEKTNNDQKHLLNEDFLRDSAEINWLTRDKFYEALNYFVRALGDKSHFPTLTFKEQQYLER